MAPSTAAWRAARKSIYERPSRRTPLHRRGREAVPMLVDKTNPNFVATPATVAACDESASHRLREVALLFTRLGFTAFGGPAAHVAMMEEEVVVRRKWIDRQHFLDLLAAVNFIPGPNS